MALTFSELQSDVKRRATKDQGGTQFDTAVKNAINGAIKRIAREALWRQLRRETTFTTVASQEAYKLPIQVSHRMFMWHEEYGGVYTMRYIPEIDFYSSGVTRSDTGTPTHYHIWEHDMALEQPSSASAITVVSSSSADTSVDVTVRGVVGGYPDYEVITTNASDGTTSVAGSKSFTRIESITKGASTTGTITATSNSGAVTVAVIPVGDTTIGVNYPEVSLYPVPSSAFTMNIKYYKDVYDLVNSGDVHDLGADFDEAIILLASSKVDYETNKLEGDRMFQMYRDELKSLKRVNVDKMDWFPKLRRGGRGISVDYYINPYLKVSQVGSNFGRRG